MGFTDLIDFGKSLDETTIKTGLQDLQPGMHFDMLTNIGQWHPYQSERQGVWYEGKHICSMDRGMIPEYKLFSVEESIQEVSPMEADSKDSAQCIFIEIQPEHELYHEALSRAEAKHDNYCIRDGKVYKYTHFAVKRCKGDIIKLGWRHVFERLVGLNIPGITRKSLAEKFGVDMYKFPVGPPEEVYDALVRE